MRTLNRVARGIPLFLSALIFGLTGCVHNSSNPTAPLNAEGGMGRIACSIETGNIARETIIDSTGAVIQDVQSLLSPQPQGGAGWSSGSGRFVWFANDSADPGGLAEVIVSDNSGTLSTPIFLTHNDTLSFAPVISADGSHVAYVTRYGAPPYYMEYPKLVVVSLGESGDSLIAKNPHIITSYLPRNAGFALSPDGSQIAFDDTAGNLVAVSTDGSGTSSILASLRISQNWYGNGWTMDWSSQNQLALASGGIVRVVSATGGTPSVVDSGEGVPCWSQDGSALAYANMKGDIIVTNDLGKTKTNITNDTAQNGAPSWSSDGKTILYTANVGSFFQQPGPPSSIVLVDVATKAKRTVASNAGLAVWLR